MEGLREQLAEHHAASFGWALSCCGRDEAVAEDVLQDAYFKVLDGRARFGGQSSFKTWLFGVIRLTAREHRRFSLRRLFETHDDETPDSKRAPDSEAGARERSIQLAKALEHLADRQREVLHLVFYEDLTIAEAAAIMNVSLGTARQHYERGKHALAAILEKSDERR